MLNKWNKSHLSIVPTSPPVLTNQLDQEVRRILSIIGEFDFAQHNTVLSSATKSLLYAKNASIKMLLEQNQTIEQQKQHIEKLYDNARYNLGVMDKFQALNLGLKKMDTILMAILYIKKSIAEEFPGVTMRIILTPNQNENGNIVENHIAQMLADSIEMINIRTSDDRTTDEREQKGWLYEMANLLPVVEGAIHTEGLPSEMHILSSADREILVRSTEHVLTPEEVGKLDKNVFGNPWSARVNHIEGVGQIVFLSEDPEHYNPHQDTFLVKNAIKILSMSLSFIGRSEKNEKDLLTGLLLRRNFREKANRAFDIARENGKDISFVFIDIDHFKKVNDTYGHAAGDLVIQTLAKMLLSKLKTDDIKVRWGGEEFGVLMQTDLKWASGAMERVTEPFKNIVFQVDTNWAPSICVGFQWSGYTTFSVTLSVGVAGNGNEDSFEWLVREADKRLYQAKYSGRDRIVSGDEGKEIL